MSILIVKQCIPHQNWTIALIPGPEQLYMKKYVGAIITLSCNMMNVVCLFWYVNNSHGSETLPLVSWRVRLNRTPASERKF
jgi:hypothetical protein